MSEGLVKTSKPLNYIFQQMNYAVNEGRENKWFCSGFIELNELNYYRSKYNLRFPVFSLKFKDKSDSTQSHIIFVGNSDNCSTFTRNNEEVVHYRIMTSGQSRIGSYKTLGSLKGYLGQRVGCEETAEMLDKVKDSKAVNKFETELTLFAITFTRLIKILNYLPENLLSVVQYPDRMQLRCLPEINNGVTDSRMYKLTIELTKSLICVNTSTDGERKPGECVRFDDTKKMNETFKSIIKILNENGIETPVDMNYYEEEEF